MYSALKAFDKAAIDAIYTDLKRRAAAQPRHSVTVRRAMQDLADGKGKATIANEKYGDINFPLGSFGRMTPNGNIRHGLGLLHIVYARMAKEGATLDEAVDTAISVAEAAESGNASRDEKNRLWLNKNGVRAVVAKNADGKKIITGYEIYAEEPKVTNRANFGSDILPTPRSEDVLSALKSRLAELSGTTAHIIPYSGAAAQEGRSITPAEDAAYADAGNLIPLSQRFNPKNADIRYSVRTTWRTDFPKAVAQTTRANIMAKYGDLFRKAKAGDEEAAADLIEKVVKPEKIRALVAEHPNASIVVPVYAEESTGRNKIPMMFAEYIAGITGIDVATDIMQSVRAFHTESSAEHRLFVQPEFDGPVKRGAEYIVVDDHITQGGTVNALRDHIESNGGKVVAIAALTLSQGSSILSPHKDTIDEIKRKWPDINRLLRAAGIADRVEALTESQLRYILKFSPDTFRTRIASERRERDARVGEAEVRIPPSEGVARDETQAERAAPSGTPPPHPPEAPLPICAHGQHDHNGTQ